ncbi:Hypothetical protein SCF082_LOCUS31666 [Durusdinium trenchii]|uniref:Uncharacterized protein n=1 Tax=Durusdinium trenchii TaxID=1381693 RepID=A0ABP0NCD6_9DINO
MAHLSLVAKSSSGEAILALQMTSQELLAWADPTKLPEEGRVPYSSCTASTDDVSTEGRNGQKQSLTGTRDTDLSSGKIFLDDGSIVGKNISYRRRKCDAKLLLKLLERRERRSKRKPKKPSKVKEAESADFNDQSSQQKVSFRCGGSEVRSQSSRLSAANSVVLACRQLLGPLHEHLPPPQYISRRMEDHLQCSAEMVKLKTCSEIARHRQKQEMDDWKAQAEAHQLSATRQQREARVSVMFTGPKGDAQTVFTALSREALFFARVHGCVGLGSKVMLAKSALPNNTQIPEQLWRSEAGLAA